MCVRVCNSNVNSKRIKSTPNTQKLNPNMLITCWATWSECGGSRHIGFVWSDGRARRSFIWKKSIICVEMVCFFLSSLSVYLYISVPPLAFPTNHKLIKAMLLMEILFYCLSFLFRVHCLVFHISPFRSSRYSIGWCDDDLQIPLRRPLCEFVSPASF